MNNELLVLRAILQLSRRSRGLSLDAIGACVRHHGGNAEGVPTALAALASAGWLTQHNGALRLSLSGLAVAVATEARDKPAAKKHRKRKGSGANVATLVPIERRGRVAA
jgi:hypothetical protein